MRQKIDVLCAVRESGEIRLLAGEMDDGELWTLRIAHSGTQALRAVQHQTPDILVADDVLPGIDGPGLVDRLRDVLGERMPRVIGGVMMPFSKEAFRRRGVVRLIEAPWRRDVLRSALLDAAMEIESTVDWNRIEGGDARARALLEQLGMRSALHGFAYLSLAAALAANSESRMDAIAERIYAPIADREHTTIQNVERLIRHAVESTMDTIGAEEIYAFFGNTIDPTRGKPTNAQMIAMLAQRVRAGEKVKNT